MPKLDKILPELLARAEAGDTRASAELGRGLKVWARVTEQGRQLVLTREGLDDPQKLRTEARVCADKAGWPSSTVGEWTSPHGARCLTVTELGLPRSPYPAGTCGSCDHAIPSGEAHLLDCTLGWEAHDAFWSARDKQIVAMGHGEALIPQSSPACRCGAGVAGRMAWTPRPGMVQP